MTLKTREINSKSSQKGDAWGVPRRWGGSPEWFSRVLRVIFGFLRSEWFSRVLSGFLLLPLISRVLRVIFGALCGF